MSAVTFVLARCGTCAHWQPRPDTKIDGAGECKRFPPTAFMVPQQNPLTGQVAITIQSFYPAVHAANDYCGEHRAKDAN